RPRRRREGRARRWRRRGVHRRPDPRLHPGPFDPPAGALDVRRRRRGVGAAADAAVGGEGPPGPGSERPADRDERGARRARRGAGRCLLAGASAVEMTSAVIVDGFEALSRAIDGLRMYLDEQGRSASAIIGEATDHVETYEERGARSGVEPG